MAVDLLIRDGEVVTPQGVIRGDVGIENGLIVEVGAGLRVGAREEIDASGLHVFPGLIDPHVHFNEPGRTEWEGIATGSAALSAGGGTCFFDMPLNSSPPVLDAESFDGKRSAAESKARTDFGLWGGLTPLNLDKLEELADCGVVGFKAFMSNSGIADFPAADDYTLYRGMQIAAQRGLLVAVHAENDSITGSLAVDAIRRGAIGARDYLDSRPVIAEVEAIQRIIALAAETRCRLHIVHVSSARGAAVAVAGRASADVTYETCPHYFLMTADEVERVGPAAKCAPPQRGRSDVEQLLSAFRSGEIDFVASDHSPSPASMKVGNDWFKIWGGIAGVQTTLSAMLSIDPALPFPAVAALTSHNIANRFRIEKKGIICTGYDADLALVDVAARYELSREMLLDRHKLSPYIGREFRGVVRRTLVRGRTIFQDGHLVGTFRGRLIRPSPAEVASAAHA